MNNWISKYASTIISSAKQHSIVCDIFGFISYPEVKAFLVEKGYGIFQVNSNLDFRLLWELEIKECQSPSIITVPLEFQLLPDIEPFCKFSTIYPSDIFANLSQEALEGLSSEVLETLFNLPLYSKLSQASSFDYILEHGYNFIASPQHKNELLLAKFIALAFGNQALTPALNNYLNVKYSTALKSLSIISLEPALFLKSLQSLWELWVLTPSDSPIDFSEYNLQSQSSMLFAMGLLNAIELSPSSYKEASNRIKYGIYFDLESSKKLAFENILKVLEEALVAPHNNTEFWFKNINLLAKGKVESIESLPSELSAKYLILEKKFNELFQTFIDASYNSLFSLSGIKRPYVVSRFLEHIFHDHASKKLLLIIDGLNYWQWSLIKDKLGNIPIEEQASFAFLPSITAWSRQAIFKGGLPNLEKDNGREAKDFEDYFTNKQLPSSSIYYAKFHYNAMDFDLNPELHKVAALVTNDLDNLMHGALMGNSQLLSATNQWIDQSGIIQSIEKMLALGYKIYLSTDHGNIEAQGLKNLSISEKVGTLGRSKRHLHFTETILLEDFLKMNAGLDLGIKDNSVYLRQYEAFTNTNASVVTHGGSHFWEVLIPFIKIG